MDKNLKKNIKALFDLIIDVKSSIFNIKKRNFHIENFVKL